jgi:hypothetical protein
MLLLLLLLGLIFILFEERKRKVHAAKGIFKIINARVLSLFLLGKHFFVCKSSKWLLG